MHRGIKVIGPPPNLLPNTIIKILGPPARRAAVSPAVRNGLGRRKLNKMDSFVKFPARAAAGSSVGVTADDSGPGPVFFTIMLTS